MPRDTKKANTKDKGKNIVPAHQKFPRGTEIQSMVDLSKELATKVDKIYFGVKRVFDLYDEWVDTLGFNP